jgi:sialate O-acetylesterase
VGLIGSNWGGTRIEPWIPPVGFQQVPKLAEIANNLDKFPRKVMRPDPRNPGKQVSTIDFQTALALYNGMIHPLQPFAIRGALWYQGESNNGEGMLYLEKMKALIGGWRTVWDNPKMPFYFVQLAPYRYGGDTTRLAGMWDAQRQALAIPNTGMAVTTDIGNVRDIHPRNKQEVGRRLALWALKGTYGKKLAVWSGPLYKSASVEGSAIRIRFDQTGSGLASRDGKPLSHFTIAGEDGNFVPATAEIDGSTVKVRASAVEAPKYVRFGWDEQAEPNLANKEGLPASPFRTGK